MLTEPKEQEALSDELRAKIDLVLESHDNDFTQIVGILLDTQDLFERHYVPQAAAYYIASKLPVPASRIFDCLTFYAELSDKPRAKYPIEICSLIACHVNNNEELKETLEKLLGIHVGEVTYDGRFMLLKTTCFGACDRAPAVRINGKVYGNLDSEEKVRDLLESLN